jgi:FkbM family methyltransferase
MAALRELGRLARFVWSHPLNAGHRIAALGRVARWQLASRLLAGPIALPFVEGTSLFARRGMAGATGNWYCGLHEVREMAFVLHVLRKDDHFVDVGANVGSYTVLAGGAVGARVTAVEPVPETFQHLMRNVALNGLTARVRACPCGLSDAPGRLRFTEGLDTMNRVLAEGEELSAVEVPVRTLDEVVGADTPILIKIDVEGHERAVLRGGTRTLADPVLLAVVMETNASGARYGIDDAELFSLMRGHGFSPWGYDPFARRLVDVGEGGGNTVFVRDRAAVEERVRSAREYRLVNGSI